MTLPAGMNADRLLEEALREKVMFVTGSCYFANGGGESSLRLNFSAYGEEKLTLGIEQLAGDRAQRTVGVTSSRTRRPLRTRTCA